MDIRLIFRNYCWFINEGTHPSIFRALLDWRRDIEKVRQANPFDITLRYFWNFGVSQGNEIKQGAGKIFYTRSCLISFDTERADSRGRNADKRGIKFLRKSALSQRKSARKVFERSETRARSNGIRTKTDTGRLGE